MFLACSSTAIARAQGVCVCAYGTDEFPAFFMRRSGCTAPARADDPDAAARMISAALQLDLDSGIVIGWFMNLVLSCLHPVHEGPRSCWGIHQCSGHQSPAP